MGIEGIVKRIEEEARAEADAILEEARQRARKMREEARSVLDVDLKEMEKKLERELSTTRNIYISDGKRKARQALLCSKEELIWDALCGVRERITSLEGPELGEYLIPLVKRAEGILGKEMVAYPVRDRDARAIEGWCKVGPLVESSLKENDELGRFMGKELLGGFIALDKKGERVMDMTFHGLLERNEDELREIIARVMFSGLQE
ncbi:MAG: V-type ATP synthase subunit E [Thermoplasmatota archaeon]